MGIDVIITEEEILKNPNYYDLGELVFNRYWSEKEVDWDIDDDTNKDEFDKCVICGKVSPYFKTTHIDLRTGYVEGSGQGCFNLVECKR